jgi:hypothetical protein
MFAGGWFCMVMAANEEEAQEKAKAVLIDHLQNSKEPFVVWEDE